MIIDDILNTDACCGSCKYHVKQGDEWVCVNEDSDNYALETDYEEYCFEWEER